ncbi:Plasmodium variant antigen protein Cir/Yir/Bir, putative [Plasmodium chabaudi adami]|uniref:Plasmodium variant antigen protein Cir/Yir/Bir, putative n=1 Tax=Plasmodium chabaudi adami TaxID=5826 RepID=A0A1C6X8X1_PLACE|nr:Plasmodium variant antigen protein Cir/Yir/Bir, putative [Plasmodium chabaudi adami]
MIKEVCDAFKVIDKFIWVERKGAVDVVQYNDLIKAYCPLKDNSRNNECHSYDEMISSIVLFFLKYFEISYDYNDDLKNDKLVEYAILWLSYKLNQHSQRGIKTLNDFYTKHIEKNEKYNEKINKASDNKTYKDVINKKNNFMSMNINDISQFYDALKSLCGMYNELDAKNNNCAKCSKDAKEFVEKYNELNENSDVTRNSSYSQILSSLFNDYSNFKSYRAEKCSGCNDVSTLLDIKAPQNPAQISVESVVEISEATSSSSSIASKLIPVLLTFTIPFFLGIAYKYSLFGFDKRFQRQYLREKLKKIKRKMNNYI